MSAQADSAQAGSRVEDAGEHGERVQAGPVGESFRGGKAWNCGALR